MESLHRRPLDDYYGPLLTQHIRTILESGLLLDEDYEVLLKASNFKIYRVKATKLPLGLIASTLTTLGFVFVARRYNVPIVILPPLTVTLGLFCLNRKSMLKSRRHKEVVNYLIQNLIKVQKLNAALIRYAKLRKELSSTKEKEILLYNQNTMEFIKFYVEQYREYFNICLGVLKLLANLTNGLSDDFKGLKQMDIEAILVSEYSSFNDYLIIASKVHDVYTFLSSKLLNYLALTFCKNLDSINATQLEFLLNTKISSITATLDKLYGTIQKEFSNVRYCSIKKIEIDTRNKRSFSRHVSGKLQQTLMGAVNNLSIIMEKSQTVLYKVENAENENDVNNLESALGDLRDHALATYESLDVLCKLFGIFSEANRTQPDIKTNTNTEKNTDLNLDAATVNYDDTCDAVEENYELFIPKNETLNVIEEQEICVDQSGIYLNLMLKELRQSLKQHERFIAARDKRGINEEDEENKLEKEELKPRPKFNLRPLQTEALTLEESSNDSIPNVAPVPSPRASKQPPPPPPSPNFSIFSSDDTSSAGASKKGLLESIRTLSSQIQSKEDVFGNGESSSDSD